ncbi:flagellar hook assembly protein FlgD [Massilia endophytica]|uniref:flagellar hook assembly protein FlgD n=1 Tax=Massilia endophytica TaxID=2899220 RepID=UPI001E3AF610|nr:flagellar hook assembly protein FlgD [Massilia endophytica]UGQ45230.1 flagellar hook assembly protein FlgD [Massilia endophytica]
MAVATTNTNTAPSSALLNAVNPKGPSTSDKISAEQDKFMTLLITQLKNQDPLNPLDNAQVTSQLAQLNTVTGINKLNDTLETLRSDQQAAANLQATSLINHGILAPGTSIQVTEGKGIFGLELATSADEVTVDIKDKAGNIKHTITMNDVDAGALPMVWDGKLKDGSTIADGNYVLSVKAKVKDEPLTSEQVRTLSFGTVASVSNGAGGVKLNIPNLGQLTMDDIKQIL